MTHYPGPDDLLVLQEDGTATPEPRTRAVDAAVALSRVAHDLDPGTRHDFGLVALTALEGKPDAIKALAAWLDEWCGECGFGRKYHPRGHEWTATGMYAGGTAKRDSPLAIEDEAARKAESPASGELRCRDLPYEAHEWSNSGSPSYCTACGITFPRFRHIGREDTPDSPTPEPRWSEWARHIAPLIHDGLIDVPGERRIEDKAFVIAKALDSVLPTDSPTPQEERP